MAEEGGHKIVAQNRKARFNYHIVEVCEAGIALTGAEVKSVREGKASITESYISPSGDELFLVGAHIPPYVRSGTLAEMYDPIRKRKLLLHRSEITKLIERVEAKGCTLVPLSLYFKNGRLKVEVALAKGKAAPDKRDTNKARDAKREIDRAIKRR